MSKNWKFSNLIKLDYDGKRLPIRRINYVFKFLRLHLKNVKVYKTLRLWKPSRKTDYGWHVKLETKERIPMYHLGYVQALMGSCWRRECYNFLRIVNLLTNPKIKGAIRQNWNVLYSEKKVGGKVASVEKFDKEATKKLKEMLKWRQ